MTELNNPVEQMEKKESNRQSQLIASQKSPLSHSSS